jgi:hypothetical protein
MTFIFLSKSRKFSDGCEIGSWVRILLDVCIYRPISACFCVTLSCVCIILPIGKSLLQGVLPNALGLNSRINFESEMSEGLICDV